MFQLLIADDEKTIREGLCSVVNWAELGFQLAASAADGKTALQILQTKPIDVILTDIRMPECSGLELIRQARKLNPKVKAVVISGYSDFEYARESIELHVENYILKPIDINILRRTFQQLAEQLCQNQNVDIQQYINELVTNMERGTLADCEAATQAFLESLQNLPMETERANCAYVIKNLCAFFHLNNEAVVLQPTETWEKLAEVFRTKLAALAQWIPTKSEGNAGWLCKKAKYEIDSDYSNENLSLTSIADKLGVSRSYLSSIFVEQYKITLKSYIIQVRMQNAQKLLMQRSYKVYEIAAMVGYSNTRYFTDAFRKYYGVSPKQKLNAPGNDLTKDVQSDED